MSRYLPIVLGILAIVGLTIPQIRMSDRFADTNFSAEQQTKLLDRIPMRINDWQGEDIPVDSTVRQTAGAVGAISRIYRNVRTGDKVDLWLIVGHGRVIAAHTPNICYQASGFEMRAAENSLYPMAFTDPPSPFLTNTFFKEDKSGRRLVRVFWSWYNPESEENGNKVVWEAPSNSRWHFGNTRALYKMYFTSEMRDPLETTELSACLRFAREFLPVVNDALAQVNLGAAPSNASADDATAAAPNSPTEAEEKSAAATGGAHNSSAAAVDSSSM
jgi:hypothetical protein